MTSQQFRDALAIVESNNDPHAWGDSGLAMGRWQVHPAWVYGYLRITGVQPGVRESWDGFVGRIVEAFFESRPTSCTPIQSAMWFHLGHRTDESQGDWDIDYAGRFLEACEKIGANAHND
jgi:hypothetical protein